MSEEKELRYSIWGKDRMVYGPVSQDLILDWGKQGRINKRTWIHDHHVDFWLPANKLEFLIPHLEEEQDDQEGFKLVKDENSEAKRPEIDAQELRRVNIFSELSNHKLEQVLHFSELKRFGGGKLIVKKDEPGESLYIVIHGLVTASTLVPGGERKKLAEIGEGNFFGEISFFTNMPRSADVYSEMPSLLLVIDYEAMTLIEKEIPELSTIILRRMAHELAQRIIRDNKRLQTEGKHDPAWI